MRFKARPRELTKQMSAVRNRPRPPPLTSQNAEQAYWLVCHAHHDAHQYGPGMTSQTRQRGSIRRRGDAFEVRVYAGLDPLTKQRIDLTETAAGPRAAEKVRTKLLAQVDECRHPKGEITIGKVIDQWMEVARIEESTRDRYEFAIGLYLKPTFGDLQGDETRPAVDRALLRAPDALPRAV
ncbi:hypothetical protein [Streptomyces sp. NPDC001970]